MRLCSRKLPSQRAEKMKLASCASLLLALPLGACSRQMPNVDFCKVLDSKAAFQDREFKTEILVIGGAAIGFGCRTGAAMAFSDSKFDGSPQLRKLEENIRAIDLHLSASASTPPYQVKGVIAHITARLEEWPGRPGMYSLKVLSARDSRVIDVPDKWLWPLPGSKPPERER